MPAAPWSSRRTARIVASLALLGSVAGCSGHADRADVRLVVTPRDALYDAPLAIEAAGLKAGTTATLRLSTRDAGGTLWSSHATFTVGGDGRVSGRQRAIRGSYRGAQPNGLLTTLSPRPAGGHRFVLPDRWTMTVSVAVGGKVQSRRTIVRRQPVADRLVTRTALRPGYFGDPRAYALPAAEIPVDRLAGPVFTVCGKQDLLWDSCAYAAEIGRKAATRPTAPPPTQLTFPLAGHLVGSLIPFRPSVINAGTTAEGVVVHAGGTPAADAAARAVAWPRLLRFLS